MAFNFLRSQVSQDKKRFKDGHFDLDLTYIRPNIIAMGYPASGVEATYRNSLTSVAEMLNTKHPDSYLVFNLSERPYDSTLLNGKVLDIGFPDHHAPPISLIFKLMMLIHSWLTFKSDNVVVVHCLAGRGRTGTIICCYLIFCGLFTRVDHVLTYYAKRRSNSSQGVSQPSQVRYVNYFQALLEGKPTEKDDVASPEQTQDYPNFSDAIPVLDPRPVCWKLHQVSFTPIPMISSEFGIRPLLYIYNYSKNKEDLIYCSETKREKAKHYVPASKPKYQTVTFHIGGKELKGDIVIKLYHITTGLLLNTKHEEVVRLIFNTGFIKSNGSHTFKKADLDKAYKDTRFPATFELRLKFDVIQNSEIDDTWPEDSYRLVFNTHHDLKKTVTPIDLAGVPADPSGRDDPFFETPPEGPAQPTGNPNETVPVLNESTLSFSDVSLSESGDRILELGGSGSSILTDAEHVTENWHMIEKVLKSAMEDKQDRFDREHGIIHEDSEGHPLIERVSEHDPAEHSPAEHSPNLELHQHSEDSYQNTKDKDTKVS